MTSPLVGSPAWSGSLAGTGGSRREEERARTGSPRRPFRRGRLSVRGSRVSAGTDSNWRDRQTHQSCPARRARGQSRGGRGCASSWGSDWPGDGDRSSGRPTWLREVRRWSTGLVERGASRSGRAKARTRGGSRAERSKDEVEVEVRRRERESAPVRVQVKVG